ncbi:MAG: hypothetical protein OEW75_18630 [Cyclobacteriaceae bacterium]|nr:hypothetical protein [Cyclobacteriaceae bacterium]
MRNKSVLLFLLLTFWVLDISAQRNSRYDYGKELIWGVNKNTTGGLIGGAILRGSRKIGDGRFESIGVELMNLKHPKEYRWHSARTGSFFIYGKTNYLLAIRTQYGREYIVFNKAPEQGVEIKLNLAAGPSIGLLAPYYVEKCIDCLSINSPSQNVIYEPGIPFSDIRGPGRFLMGLDESKLRMGFNVKTSLSFELGVIRSQVTGFEIGGLLDMYASKNIILMANTTNKSVFPTAFITFFYGTRR